VTVDKKEQGLQWPGRCEIFFEFLSENAQLYGYANLLRKLLWPKTGTGDGIHETHGGLKI